jgi:hypothetical protein
MARCNTVLLRAARHRHVARICQSEKFTRDQTCLIRHTDFRRRSKERDGRNSGPVRSTTATRRSLEKSAAADPVPMYFNAGGFCAPLQEQPPRSPVHASGRRRNGRGARRPAKHGTDASDHPIRRFAPSPHQVGGKISLPPPLLRLRPRAISTRERDLLYFSRLRERSARAQCAPGEGGLMLGPSDRSPSSTAARRNACATPRAAGVLCASHRWRSGNRGNRRRSPR